MTAEIHQFPWISDSDLPPDRVISESLGAGMTEVVIIGYDADGNDYYNSSMPDAKRALWHLERAKWRLMRQCDELEAGE